MKNGSHLEVVASIKDMNTDLKREFEVSSEEYNQASRGFCPSKTLNLLRVITHILSHFAQELTKSYKVSKQTIVYLSFARHEIGSRYDCKFVENSGNKYHGF